VKHSILQGRLELAAGRWEQARARFEWAFDANSKNASAAEAAMGEALVDLAMDDASAAIVNARIALDIAVALQGGFPYSNNTGHAWLILGRALQANGDAGGARQAFEAAVLHLEHTVDPDHPALVQARQLILM
jgi:tetratricopeptide (TPR) repeat protein